MESIGAKLKQARNSKGVSIEEAQKDTHIQAKILRALEDGRITEAASSPIYARSFLRKYADYLGLDGSSLVEEYSKGQTKKQPEPFLAIGKAQAPAFPFGRVFSIAICILIMLLGFRFLVFIGSKAKAGFKFRQKVAAKVAAGQPAKKTKKSAPPAAKPAVLKQIQKGEELLFSVKAKSDVWLKIVSDGRVVYENILKRGSQESWGAKEEIVVSTGRAEALIAQLNGAALGQLGKGVLKDIVITREGVKLSP